MDKAKDSVSEVKTKAGGVPQQARADLENSYVGELIICWVETHWQVFKEVRVSCAGCCVKSRLAPGRLEPEKSKDCVVNNLHKCMKHIEDSRQQAIQGFPGGLVVKNPLVIAGNIDSILGPGRSHMPWNN